MNKVLICYFSASGVTKGVAESIATAVNGDLFEIEPKEKYTKEDLDWTNKQSRSSIEMADKTSRPEVVNKIDNLGDYDKIIIGFPVWWYTFPTIISTFIEENDLTGKKIYVYVTSGGSSEVGSFDNLKETYPELDFVSARRFKGSEANDIYTTWLED